MFINPASALTTLEANPATAARYPSLKSYFPVNENISIASGDNIIVTDLITSATFDNDKDTAFAINGALNQGVGSGIVEGTAVGTFPNIDSGDNILVMFFFSMNSVFTCGYGDIETASEEYLGCWGGGTNITWGFTGSADYDAGVPKASFDGVVAIYGTQGSVADCLIFETDGTITEDTSDAVVIPVADFSSNVRKFTASGQASLFEGSVFLKPEVAFTRNEVLAAAAWMKAYSGNGTADDKAIYPGFLNRA